MTILKAKQEAFCQQYVIDLNGTQAAIRAGYSKKTATEQSSRLLTIVKVQQRVAELQAEILERNKLKADDVVAALRLMAEWNIQDFLTDDNDIIPLKKLNRNVAYPVAGIKVKKTVLMSDGKQIGIEITTELKFTDKRAAEVDLGRHLGIFKEDNDQKKPSFDFNDISLPEMSNDQLHEYLNGFKS